MDDEFTFSILRDDCSDLSELIDLTKTYYSEGDIINRDYLDWQYLKNPNGKPYLFISRENRENELAGQYLVIPVKYSINGITYMGTLSLNTITKPKYQFRGLFTKMALATYQDCANNNAFFTIGFPNQKSYHGLRWKLNFTHVGDVPLLIKPLNITNLLLSALSRQRKKHAGEITMTRPPDLPDQDIKEVSFTSSSDMEKMDRYWNKLMHQYPVSTCKDSAYMKWRYSDIPTRKYYLYGIQKDDEWEAIIVLKMEKTLGFKVGFIMDFTCLDRDSGAVIRLLKFAMQLCKRNELDMVAAMNSPENPDYKLLKKLGFYGVPEKMMPQQLAFMVRINKEFPAMKEILEFKNWKLAFGDFDIF